MEVRWSEGVPNPDFTRTIFLYLDGHVSGFVAESGETGWLAFKFSRLLGPTHQSLVAAKSKLIEACLEEGNN